LTLSKICLFFVQKIPMLVSINTLFSYVVDIFFPMEYGDTRIVTYGLLTHIYSFNEGNLAQIMPGLTPRCDREF